jgi:ribose transport system ATP-binding protein
MNGNLTTDLDAGKAAFPASGRTPKLQTFGLRREYPGTVALDKVSVSFAGGKVHALLGKNGAGKSTLVKILAGTLAPTRGELRVDGRPVVLRSAQDAFREGIATVYQELSLIPGLSVAENILLGRLLKRRGLVDWPETHRRAQAVLAEMQVTLDARQKAGDLSVAQQQVVEIAKAMSFQPSVLMLDEPTSALAHHETESLFRLVRQLAARGVAVIYITHRLQELPQIADTVTVLRDGRLAGVLEMKEASPEQIVRLMFGEVVQKPRPAGLQAGTKPVLEVRGLGRGEKFRDVNFTLREGEVLGIAGMLGAGRTELLRALFGAEPPDAGEIRLDGERVAPVTLRAMKQRGLAYTPEDRKAHALVQGLSTRANMVLANLTGITTRQREAPIVRRLVEQLAIKVPDIELPVSSLSGGNQQKVVVGKWLHTKPRVVLFDEPTRGIDVQAKQQIFQIMWDLSREGVSSIFVSSELEELVEVCHRILIMKRGAITGEVRPEEVGADELYLRCMEE